MTLRRKIVFLLCAFAGFAVMTAGATIYGLQWQIQAAVRTVESAVDQTVQVDRLRITLKEQTLYLNDLLKGRREASRSYFASRDEFATRLRQAANFADPTRPRPDWERLLSLAGQFEDRSDRFLAMLDAGDAAGAAALLVGPLESELFPAMDSQLRRVKTGYEEARAAAVRDVGATTGQILALTVTVGVLGALLVVFGASLIRRWLILPIQHLHQAARRFRDGELDYRVSLADRDELGQLGEALNSMADSVASAQAELKASEEKHRALFRNLRDAVVICNVDGLVQEYHEGETGLLGFEGDQQTGRFVLDVWPAWRTAADDWAGMFRAVVHDGKRFRAVDIAVGGAGETALYADFVIYRVDYGRRRHAAVVVRDVTDRHRLQRRVRQAETMEAVGTLAGGLAHDFNNLLTSVIGSLSLLAAELKGSPHVARIQTALRAGWQAAGLSRKLLNFAGTAHGDAQIFRVRDAVEVILGSLDQPFLENLRLTTDLEDRCSVRMDRDQFTQIVLNLIRNARDAMPSGGELKIQLGSVMARSPDDGSVRRPFAVLNVRDTGEGMTAEVQRRAFEPFFTTKNRATRRGRGMGLAVVYSVVKNAGGFVQMNSEPGRGTEFRVHLPAAEGVPERADLPLPAGAARHHGEGTVLFVDEDPLIREVCRDALVRCGYRVVAVGDAAEARRKFSANGAAACGLAVIDASREGESGVALAEQLVKLDPDLRIILTTSATESEVPGHLVRHVCARLTKPFRMEALESAVAAALPPAADVKQAAPYPPANSSGSFRERM